MSKKYKKIYILNPARRVYFQKDNAYAFSEAEIVKACKQRYQGTGEKIIIGKFNQVRNELGIRFGGIVLEEEYGQRWVKTEEEAIKKGMQKL